jgi:hypothetical protein
MDKQERIRVFYFYFCGFSQVNPVEGSERQGNLAKFANFRSISLNI